MPGFRGFPGGKLVTLQIPDFSGARLLVAGDLMLDQYWFGATGRISPEAPVPVVHVRDGEERPGGAANVAVNLAELGAPAALVGIVGADEAAGRLEALLVERGVECRFAVSPAAPTTTKLRVLSRGQQLIRLDREETATGVAVSVREPFAAALQDAGLVILSDYAKGALHEVGQLIAAAREAGVPVLVDPKGTDFARYRGATLLTPNQAEFEAVAGAARDDEDLLRRARLMLDELDLEALVITRSERGMLVVERSGEAQFLSTEAREVFDVTGAGDTVIATLGAAMAAGSTLGEAAALANLAAGLVVRKIGVAGVTPSELRVALHRRGKGGRGMVDETALLEFVSEARSRGERVVMTNGCFDILHAGHVTYLEEAKSLGDRLVVAVNTDDSVRRLKGEGRPVNPVEDRMAVLAGLAAVDWVVPFAEDTPARLIEAVLPEVLVKGGDYRPEEIAGGPAVLAAGGEVRVLAFREGRSSSRIIESIRGLP